MTRPRVVRAAGCVVWRHGTREPEVLLVHRPRYDDWSFPKGKLDRGESEPEAAVREVLEETGLTVGLGPRLRDDHYDLGPLGRQPKVVSYWAAVPPHRADTSTYQPNSEIDAVTWVRVGKARSRLTYPRDVEMLDEFLDSGFDSSPLLILRHTHARNRRTWRGEDSERPLRAEGRVAAERLTPLLRAYDVRRVISSDAARCVETVLPFVNRYDVKLKLSRPLSEDADRPGRLTTVVGKALASNKRTLICSHRPLLPGIFGALGLPPISLAPGGLVVVHRKDGAVVDYEQHDETAE